MGEISQQWAVQLCARDNVATALIALAQGTIATVLMEGNPVGAVECLDAIPLGHKVSLRDIRCGESVVKWGEKIGIAKADIRRGEHVHIHNVASDRGRGDRDAARG
jgi:altronate dehydratase small subunit